MSRTANRPFVTGQFQADSAWLSAIGAILLISVLAVAWATNWWAATYTFLGAFTYAVVYTLWLKRRTWANIIVGGLAGSFAVLAGAAAVSPSIGAAGWILTAVLFLWTPPHFSALALYRVKEYERANIPMLPVTHGSKFTRLQILLYTILLVAITLMPFATGMAGWLYLFGVSILNIIFLYSAIALYRNYSDMLARKTFKYSIHYLSLIFMLLLVDHYRLFIMEALQSAL